MSDPLPLTGSDLREIADAVDEVEGTELAHHPLIGDIQVRRPDCEDPVGRIARFDENDPNLGWGVVFDDAPQP